MEENIQSLDDLFKDIISMPFSHFMIAGDFNFPQIDWTLETSSAPATHGSHMFIETAQDCLLISMWNTQLDTDWEKHQMY